VTSLALDPLSSRLRPSAMAKAAGNLLCHPPPQTNALVESLPASTVLSAGLTKRGSLAIASGGLGDVWEGEHQGSRVAIKALRTYSNLEQAKEVCVERIFSSFLTLSCRFWGNGSQRGRTLTTRVSPCFAV